MKKEEEITIKVTKEIVLKFIETGRLSLNTFDDAWDQIHKTVSSSLTSTLKDGDERNSG
jgi:hypothetical protein